MVDSGMTSLEAPGGDGIIPPDADAILEKKRAEIREAAAKAEFEPPVLTEDEEQQVVDLVNAGRKEDTFTVFGRVIRLRTLTIEEELQVSEIANKYFGTAGYPRAYRTAVVAAAIRTIDGKLLVNPISDEEFDKIIALKYNKLLGYYPLAVDQIYARYRDMELELLALVGKLGKSSG